MAVISDDSAASAWPPGLAESATSRPHNTPVPLSPTMRGRTAPEYHTYDGSLPTRCTWARRGSRNVVVRVAQRFGHVAEAHDRAACTAPFRFLRGLTSRKSGGASAPHGRWRHAFQRDEREHRRVRPSWRPWPNSCSVLTMLPYFTREDRTLFTRDRTGSPLACSRSGRAPRAAHVKRDRSIDEREP